MKMIKIIAVIVFLLMIFGTIHASEACDVALKLDFGSSGTPTSADSNWKTLSFLAVLVSGALIAVIYMLGQAIGNMNLINRAKTDLSQFIITLVVLLIFSAFVTSICSIDATQFGIRDATLFDSAKSYFAYAESVAMAGYVKIVSSIMTLSGLSGYYITGGSISIGLFIDVTLTMLPFSSLGVAVSALQYLANLVLLSISITKAYSVVTEVISLSFLNLLLPSGILLRCFTPTREIGGIFIGLSIGMFIFYPLIFSLSYLIMGQPLNENIPSPRWITDITTYTVGFSVSGFFPMGQVIFGLTSLIGPVINLASQSLYDALESVGATLLPVFIMPAINWIIIAMLVRNLSSALGAEIDISSLARMI